MSATYRFLPWARRGLSASLPDGPAGGALPPRAEVAVTVTVTGAGDVSTRALLNGPGDVVGIDPGQIVRVHPQPAATDAEPNYLAAVDFDAPELPWLFTPRGAPADGHLPPWVVLVVVEQRPGVRLGPVPGAPLPQLRIESGAAAELPDLADSWAWAHVQLVEPAAGAGSQAAVSATMSADPNRTVSRLLCPRRLAPNRRWIAAVVPSFDAGRVRGLGGSPADAALAPAWSSGADAVTLPVYYHWEFQTGAEGDFESLAQRLKPHKAATTVGLVPMHIGDAAPPLQVPAGQVRHLDMDGALRAPAQIDGRLAEVPDALRDGLKEVSRTLADAADGVLDAQILQDASRQPVGPPVYGSSHVRRWHVLDRQNDQDAEWFRELNLDPRPRVAAGLGAECVRANQEDIVNAAFAQVGQVLEAEAALQRAALAELISASFHRRHVAPMPDDRLLSLAGPLAARTPIGLLSLTAAVARTSLPDAVLDSGLRRALAPAGRAVARAAHRAGVQVRSVRPGLVASLAAGRADLDATRFERPALSGAAQEALTGSDLSGIGLPVEVGEASVTRLRASARALAAATSQPGELEQRLSVRPDVRANGLLGQAHVDAARELATLTSAAMTGAVAGGATTDLETIVGSGAAGLFDGFATASAAALAANPTAGAGVGFVIEAPVLAGVGGVIEAGRRPVEVGVLDLDAGGTLVVRSEAGRPNRPVAVIGAGLSAGGVSGLLTRLRGGSIALESAVGGERTELPVLGVGSGAAAAAAPGLARGVTVADTAAAPLRGGFSPVLREDPLAGRPLAGRPISGSIAAATPAGGLTGALRPDMGVGALRPGAGAGPGLGPALGQVAGPVVRPVIVPDPVVAGPVIASPVAGGVAAGGVAVEGVAVEGVAVEGVRPSVTAPPRIRDSQVISRLELALALQRDTTVLTVAPPKATLVPFNIATTAQALRHHVDPRIAQPLRRDALLQFSGRRVGALTGVGQVFSTDGWWASRALDRVMAYPTFPLAASDYLSSYDPTRFCPGIDTIPTDSVTLLETNPRFIAAFMAGLNHETNRELLWRGYPTDARGTPFRRFWRRVDNKNDIAPIHGWRAGSLAEQTTDPKGSLVLLVRGDLLRRYPNTIVLAMPAKGPREPDHDNVQRPIFRGQFEPDVSFFGFALKDEDLEEGQGWFFALMEPVTEPRFGLDETEGGPSGGGSAAASDGNSWPDTGVQPAGHLATSDFTSIGLNPVGAGGHHVAKALFQRPFALYVHAKHLVAPLPLQT